VADSHSIDWAKTLSQAREYENTGAYELILLDVSLPDGNGIDFLNNRRPPNSTPAIVMTSRSQISSPIMGLSAGAADYMGKPFSMSEISARIGAAVCKREYIGNKVLEIAGLIVIPSERRLYQAEKAVDLTEAKGQCSIVFWTGPVRWS
jgi:two-component system OmpR family response regulator